MHYNKLKFKVSTDILVEFLEVAFHNIIYFRKIYPDEIFVRKKIYGTAVHISEHPELNEYIRKVLTAIKELITEDEKSVKAISLTFLKDKVPVEKFVFDLITLHANIPEKDPYFIKTEESLRTICLKLSVTQLYLKPLPEDSIFSIDIITYETAHVALNENPKCEDFPWIINENQEEMKNQNLLPLKTVQTEHLTLQIYAVEDKKIKLAN